MTTKTRKKVNNSRTKEDIEENVAQEQKAEQIIVEHGRIPSPLEDSLLEFGKNLFKDSLAQSVEFHKTMLGLTATFATLMASIFGVLVFGSTNQQINKSERLFLIIPVLLMLLSSICFAFGYYPRTVQMRLRVLNTIEETRDKLLKIRRRWAFTGIVFFVLSILSLLIGIVFLNM